MVATVQLVNKESEPCRIRIVPRRLFAPRFELGYRECVSESPFSGWKPTGNIVWEPVKFKDIVATTKLLSKVFANEEK